MTKPVYEIPVGDGDSYPTNSGRRAQASASEPSGFPLAPPAAAPAFQSAPYELPVEPVLHPPAPRFESQPQASPQVATPAPQEQAAQPRPQQTTQEALQALEAQHASLQLGLQVPPLAQQPLAPVSSEAESIPGYYPPPSLTQPPRIKVEPPRAVPSLSPLQEDVAPKAKLLSEQAPQPGAGQVGSDPDLVAALNAIVLAGASDLHVGVNAPPMMRVDGGLKPMPGVPVWSQDKVNSALRSIMSAQHEAIFAEALELDFAYTLSETARFRVNIYQQRNTLGAAFRLIPTEIKKLEALGIPDKVAKFAQLPRGLVLVTGPTGSGKSTTLAALIDLVNSTRADHIVTVEDPIEFLHANKKSLVNQREVGHDTHSFNNALKHVLRQDPDVILIGELRDLETISVALTAAETGHLVFATLHTQDAAQTIDRVIDVFPPHQQGQVRAQLASTLQGVVCQTLVKKVGGGGRAVATEVLVTTPAVANLIREGKTYQIHSVMQAGREIGMHTMDQHLADLVNAGQISHQAAYDKAHDIEDLKHLIQRAGRGSTDSIDSSTKSSGIDFGDAYSSQGA